MDPDDVLTRAAGSSWSGSAKRLDQQPGGEEGGAKTSAGAALDAGHEAERYEVNEEVGRGGMAAVRRARDLGLLREVAMKTLDADSAASAECVQRFVDEAQIMGQLEHPNIVPVHDLGRDPAGLPFMCMKLVRGGTLYDSLEEAGDDRLVPDRLGAHLEVFLKVCDAVSFAHAMGVIHRDIKPANVMVGRFGEVYLLDWGIACKVSEAGSDTPAPQEEPVRLSHPPDLELTEHGAFVGTLAYMPPEQLRTEERTVDERSDVFALGATLYHILTGRPPYRSEEGPSMLLLSVYDADFPPPREVAGERVPSALERIVLKSMAKDPGERYQSVAELKGDVERFLRGTWQLPKRIYAAGARIVEEGDAGVEAFIIDSGRCRVLKRAGDRERVLRELGPGEVFGETAILTDQPRSASVEAVDPVVVRVVTEISLEQALGLASWVSPLVTTLAERFREVDGRLRELERKCSEGDDEGP